MPYNLHSSFLGTVPTGPGKKEVTTGDPAKQIFVKNCPKNWTHSDLHENFATFGEISSAKMSITANFESRGFGYIEYASVESTKKAVIKMNGKAIEVSEEAPPAGGKSSASEEEERQGSTTTTTLQVSHFESKRHRMKQSQE